VKILSTLSENIIKGNADQTEQLTRQAIDEKIPVEKILQDGLIAGMNVVGAKFKANEFYVPEVLIAARAMKAGMKILQPKLMESGIQPIATVVIGTVKGDLHDIGKNLVAMMWEGAGFRVIDIGVDATPEKFISAIEEHNANAVAMSALLTTTMTQMKIAINKMKTDGVRDRVKVLIGGAPVTQSYADEIAADGYAADAASSVELLKSLLN
jgi:5-methyltetrahydrofolate--homocysteine methyltransferase